MLAFSNRRLSGKSFSYRAIHELWRDDNGLKQQMNFSPIGKISSSKTRKAVGYLTKYFVKGQLWGGLDQDTVEREADTLKGCHFTRGYYRVPRKTQHLVYCCSLMPVRVPYASPRTLLMVCSHGARFLAPD